MRDELFLDEFIIMPNHLHAIIILKTTKIEKINDTHGLHGLHVVDTHGRAYLQTTEQTEKNYHLFVNQNLYHHLLVVSNRQ
jgi:hypothetical protein